MRYEFPTRFNQFRFSLRQTRNRHDLRRTRVVMAAIFFKTGEVLALKNRRCALASKGITAKHGWASYDAELMPPFPRVRFTRKHQQHAQVMPRQLHFMLVS